MIQIVPAIDIIDGRCVRLTRGDYTRKKVYDASPVDMARRYADCGVRRIHLVDLDGAKRGVPANLAVLEQIAGKATVELEWGGGIAGADALRDVFNAGATHAVIGSVAALKPELFDSWLLAYGGGKMILGADVKDGFVAVKGWLENSNWTLEALIRRFPGLEEVICTDIARDGMLEGPAFNLYRSMGTQFPALRITASGGIRSMDDIRQLDGGGATKAIVGKAIYENRISLQEIEQWSLNA
ncbi:MAG: 1-(5-phosphoribosyl)-5-[(5-phosphoribosylamino)methylideneamino] imidazole-4-carboxamide isomerase [Bacteroidales bacterium]|nr:1-(5-phosphoribosyl)-5-[(5-phosphoribosylamino)methylideneamino] imidazole-4-carboxamide isomerase [Bacteroidales bacterium]